MLNLFLILGVLVFLNVALLLISVNRIEEKSNTKLHNKGRSYINIHETETQVKAA
jgi:hypothetical protein